VVTRALKCRRTQSAEITVSNLDRARFDANDRISVKLLNWVTTNHDANLVQKLSAAGSWHLSR
jgi:hypothetical protein